MKVKVDKEWTPRNIEDLITKVENCTWDKLEYYENDFYVGCSKTQKWKKMKESIREETIESRHEHCTRVLNDKWVEIHFKETFCDKMDKKCNCMFTLKQERVDKIEVKMEEDQG